MVKKTFLLLACLAIGAPSLHAAKSADALFQDALMKETGERDPEAALPLYQLVVDRAGDNPKLVSKAKLHMGLCLERIGKPKDAQKIYLEIIQDSSAAPTDVVQTAQANLDKLVAQEKKAAEEAALQEAAHRNTLMIMVPEFNANGLSLLVGPAIVRGSGLFVVRGDVNLRLRIFGNRTRPLYLEFGAITPGANQAMASGTFQTSNGFPITDQAQLNLGYQIHFALVRDLPHGRQEAVVPEIGVGAAYTVSRIDVVTNGTDSFTGLPTVSNTEAHYRIWSPYLRAGIRLFANHPVSLLLGVSYTAVPYKETVETGTPFHAASFDFPDKLWTAGAQLQVRFGRTEYVARPKP